MMLGSAIVGKRSELSAVCQMLSDRGSPIPDTWMLVGKSPTREEMSFKNGTTTLVHFVDHLTVEAWDTFKRNAPYGIGHILVLYWTTEPNIKREREYPIFFEPLSMVYFRRGPAFPLCVVQKQPYPWDIEFLPQMDSEDPLSRYYDFQKGDVVAITRLNGSMCVYYRRVV